MEKTEETKEIIDVVSVLMTFCRHGIYKFSFDDVITAMPHNLLSDLKFETFGRWLRNPFYVYNSYANHWYFCYGRKYGYFNRNRNSPAFGLEDAIALNGYDNYVRWLRIWSSNYNRTYSKDSSEQINSLEKEVALVYNTGCKELRTLGQSKAVINAAKSLMKIMEKVCELKGRPDYMKVPIRIGRKTKVFISRKTRLMNNDTFIDTEEQDLIVSE